MARRCAITGKGVQSGNNVSHANNRTRRTFRPNLQVVSMMSETLGESIRMRMSTNGIRTIEHAGGFDAYLTKTIAAILTPELRRLKQRLAKARAAA
jgi:large subunit ribosomal protein L28